MPAGRPSKFSQKLVDDAWKYLDGGYKKHNQVIPSLVGMCVALNLKKSTVYDWANENHASYHKEFSDILAACNQLQEMVLLNGGLSGTMNSNIVKLVLGKHGYSDKQETNLSGQVTTRIDGDFL